jgi:hypothetical protein
MKIIAEEVKIVGKEVKVVASDVNAVVDNVRLANYWKILEWLSAGNSDTRQAELRNARVKNSGQWFLNSNQFTNWVNRIGPKCLICKGIRMTNKSIILILQPEQGSLSLCEVQLCYRLME